MSALTLAPPPEVVNGHFLLDMPEEEYHGHPALSRSGMKALLRSPRHFKAMRAMRAMGAIQAKKEFDVGHAAHSLVLGVGAPIKEIPDRLLSGEYRSISSAAAKAFRDEAQAEGFTVLKPKDYAAVSAMVEAILADEKARDLLERPGYTEASLIADDPATGVQLRSRMDRYADGIPIDVKTTSDVQTRKITNAIVDFGYDIQSAVYRELLRLVLGIEPEFMHFIFVEKTFPHDVRVIRMSDPAWVTGGERQMREAIDLFAWCNERGVWPSAGGAGPIEDLPAPGWYAARFTDAVTYEVEPF